MIDRLGAWSNAPLAYVLAEVRTENLADIEVYQPRFAGRLRESYPVQRTLKTANVIASATQPVFDSSPGTAWEYATTDNQVAVILRANGLVLHATKYEKFASFLSQLDDAVAAFAKEVPSVFVNRLGLRYIDFVVPNPGETPEVYVDGTLNPDLGLSDVTEGVVTASMSIYRKRSGAVLNLRYSRARGQPELPPDLGRLSLDKSPPMKSDVGNDHPTAVLDIDCHQPYSPVELLAAGRDLDRFASLREMTHEAFSKAVTEHALKVWKEEI